MCPQSSANVLSIFSTIVMAGGEFQLCWGLQLLDQVFQPIKKDTPTGQPIGSDPWPHPHLFGTMGGRCLQMQRILQDASKSTTGVEFFEGKIDLCYFCRNKTTSLLAMGCATLPLPSTSAMSAPASASLMDYNCPSACGQGGRKMSWPDTSLQNTSRFSVVVLALFPLISLDYTDLNTWPYVPIHLFQMIWAISRIGIAE